jgi:hypothetical protein
LSWASLGENGYSLRNLRALASAGARCITKPYDTILMSAFLFVEITLLNTGSHISRYNNEKIN